MDSKIINVFGHRSVLSPLLCPFFCFEILFMLLVWALGGAIASPMPIFLLLDPGFASALGIRSRYCLSHAHFFAFGLWLCFWFGHSETPFPLPCPKRGSGIPDPPVHYYYAIMLSRNGLRSRMLCEACFLLRRRPLLSDLHSAEQLSDLRSCSLPSDHQTQARYALPVCSLRSF